MPRSRRYGTSAAASREAEPVVQLEPVGGAQLGPGAVRSRRRRRRAAQHQHRTTGEAHRLASRDGPRARLDRRLGGRQLDAPLAPAARGREGELDVLVVAVDQHAGRSRRRSRWPCRSRSAISAPLRKRPTTLLVGVVPVGAGSCARPSARNHQASGSTRALARRRGSGRRRNTGWARRRCDQPPGEREQVRLARRRGPSRASEISLSWHQALLLPCWVRPISSPPRSIGTPWDSSSVASRLRCWRARSSTISGSSVAPSAPQFHERLSSVPSRLSSRFASLCLSL